MEYTLITVYIYLNIDYLLKAPLTAFSIHAGQFLIYDEFKLQLLPAASPFLGSQKLRFFSRMEHLPRDPNLGALHSVEDCLRLGALSRIAYSNSSVWSWAETVLGWELRPTSRVNGCDEPPITSRCPFRYLSSRRVVDLRAAQDLLDNWQVIIFRRTIIYVVCAL